jgi:DNA-binding transcriptional LysR family regulator
MLSLTQGPDWPKPPGPARMPARFTLRQLEYLIGVAESGSIALAAERLNVSSPSISTAISNLEQDFGLQLFVRRHAQGVSLTPGGARFVAQARAVLAEAQRLGELVSDITERVQGPLNVGCLVTFAQVLLPALRRSFVDTFAGVDFRQYERNQSELFEGLRTATLDVALCYDMDIPHDLDFQPLASLTPYAIFAEGHPLAGHSRVAPKDLVAHPMVLLDLPYSGNYFLSLFSDRGLKPLIAERTRDMGVMLSLVGQGFGYSVANIPPWSDRAPDGRKLSFVPLGTGVRPLQIGLLMSDGARSSLTVREFVAHCRRQLTTEAFERLTRRVFD